MLPNYTNPNKGKQVKINDEEQNETFVAEEDFDQEVYALRKLFIHIALVVALVFVWLSSRLFHGESYEPEEHTNYVDLRTLDAPFLDLDNAQRRIIVVGDLHGMLHSLDNLFDTLEYNSENDLFIHLGDLVAKGPHSNELVTRFAAANVTGVRGNNDQKVIDWYSWFDWVKSHPGGAEWLDALFARNISPEDAENRKMHKTLRYGYPKEWSWGGDHFRAARALGPTDYQYLVSLPIVLHLPSLHTFMVHAGLLPMDPAHHLRSMRQPLAVAPSLPQNPTEDDIAQARNDQEVKLLTEIEPNQDPFIKMNIRDVHDFNPTHRGPEDHDDNIPWSDLWNRVIKRCRGFDIDDSELQDEPFDRSQDSFFRKRSALPCYPITVVYSHASSRGLDLKKWSKGLDTGCVNGNGLTAMVLGHGRHKPIPAGFPSEDDDDERDIEIPFGDGLQARLVSVSCPVPPPIDD